MGYGFLLELIVVVLLVVTIGYCVALHRRLGTLRMAQDEMKQFIASFNEATARAESSVAHLRAAASESARGLQPRIEQANTLVGDLDMLTHRAGKLANRLENTATPASSARPAAKPARPSRGAKRKPATTVQSAPPTAGRSQTESELLKALREAR